MRARETPLATAPLPGTVGGVKVLDGPVVLRVVAMGVRVVTGVVARVVVVLLW
jgi:hypothetical protein